MTHLYECPNASCTVLYRAKDKLIHPTRPTEEEFSDPMAYIRKIAPEAQKDGICKIIPPKSWKPPFYLQQNYEVMAARGITKAGDCFGWDDESPRQAKAATRKRMPTSQPENFSPPREKRARRPRKNDDFLSLKEEDIEELERDYVPVSKKETFRFKTSQQWLHQLQHRRGPNEQFLARLKHYWQQKGLPLTTWVIFDKKRVDLSYFHELVKRSGGYKKVTENRKWTEIGRCLFAGRTATSVGNAMKKFYEIYLRPFDYEYGDREATGNPLEIMPSPGASKKNPKNVSAAIAIESQSEESSARISRRTRAPLFRDGFIDIDDVELGADVHSSRRPKSGSKRGNGTKCTTLNAIAMRTNDERLRRDVIYNEMKKEMGDVDDATIQQAVNAMPTKQHQTFLLSDEDLERLPELEVLFEESDFLYGLDDFRRRDLNFIETLLVSLELQGMSYGGIQLDKLRAELFEVKRSRASKSDATPFNSDWARFVAERTSDNELLPARLLELIYWDTLDRSENFVDVEYGKDLDSTKVGSGFPMKETLQATGNSNKELWDYATSPWNIYELAGARGSVLRCMMNKSVTGIVRPWCYVGMTFASFCWHYEDNYLYSINYHHRGAPKQWYGIPSYEAERFEDVMRKVTKSKSPDLVYQMTTMVSPRHILAEGIKMSKTTQQPGEFVVTFPKAYHAGFSLGFNCGEAVNFALLDWFSFGKSAVDAYRGMRMPALCHEEMVFLNFRTAVEELVSQLGSLPNECSLGATADVRFLTKALKDVVEEELSCREKAHMLTLKPSKSKSKSFLIIQPKNESFADWDEEPHFNYDVHFEVSETVVPSEEEVKYFEDESADVYPCMACRSCLYLSMAKLDDGKRICLKCLAEMMDDTKSFLRRRGLVLYTTKNISMIPNVRLQDWSKDQEQQLRELLPRGLPDNMKVNVLFRFSSSELTKKKNTAIMIESAILKLLPNYT